MSSQGNRKPFKPGQRSGGRPQGGHRRNQAPARPPRFPVNGRDATLRLVRKQMKRFPDLDLTSPETDSLDQREAAYAHALYDVILRRWLTLRFLLEPNLDQPWFKIRPEALTGLMGGLAELLYMRSVPPHAAIHEAVEWTKAHGGRGAGGLVNAVLRRLQRELLPEPVDPAAQDIDPETHFGVAPDPASDVELERDPQCVLPGTDGKDIVLKSPELPTDPIEGLAVASSTPRDLLNVWSRSLALSEVRSVAMHGLVSPPTILNVSFAKHPIPEELAIPHDLPGHAMFVGTNEELRRLLQSREDVWVQDPASTLAVESVSDLTPELIIDLCAGLGTKTRQLTNMFPNARVIATDVDAVRFDVLKDVFGDHARVDVVAFEEIRERYMESADLILLDVPCSNTGVLARRVEARYRYSPRRREELVGVQRQIIIEAIPLLKRNDNDRLLGRILYSTCSLDPEENQEQAKWASRWHHFTIAREHVRKPTGGLGDSGTRYSDGSYAVLLEP